MRILLIAMAAAMLLAASSSPGIAQVERPDKPSEEIATGIIGDGIVVPGERIGPLRLGMTPAQMIRLMPLGYRREAYDKEDVIVYEWRREGVWVSLDGATRQVRLISVFGTGAYKTDKGVVLLQTESKMEATYGRNYRRYEYPDDKLTLIRYVALGLQLGIVNYPSQRAIHGRIFTMGIFTPGKEPPLAKSPTK